MSWHANIRGFQAFLRMEKSLSPNSIKAYTEDLNRFVKFLEEKNYQLSVSQIEHKHLVEFIAWLNKKEISAATQARVLSGIRAFYKYLLLENLAEKNPAELLEMPRAGRKLPDVLSVEDIVQLLSAIDLSAAQGHRNRAILELLYSCGLRVSEAVNLKISDLFFDSGFIRITGKGDKQRLAPIGRQARRQIMIYLNEFRNPQTCLPRQRQGNLPAPPKAGKPQPGYEDFLFLNNRGTKLTTVMVFLIIKKLAAKIGLTKKVSPHIFRHSYATHLVENGADIRAVQEMLGHESITTTEIYTHLDKKYLRKTIEQFHPRANTKN